MQALRQPLPGFRLALFACAAGAMLLLTACGGSRPKVGILPSRASMAAMPYKPQPESNTVSDTVTTPSGLRYIDTKVGEGAEPHLGQIVTVHYTGWLYNNGEKGSKFDSSVDRGKPFKFVLGVRQVILGWDEGVATMKVGGKRTLILPPDLGYGARGAGAGIPPNSTLIFDVELLGAEVRPKGPA